MDVKNILMKYFTAMNSVKLAILYGSFARGMETKKSDIDIAIAGNGKYPSSLLADLNLETAKLLNKKADIVDLNNVSGTILTQILTKGIILKKTDTILYAELITKMLYFEEDMAPNIRYILDYRKEIFLNAK